MHLEQFSIIQRSKNVKEIEEMLLLMGADNVNVAITSNRVKCSTFEKSGTYEIMIIGNKVTKEVLVHVPGEQLRIKKDVEIVIEDLEYRRKWFFFDWRVFKKV